MRFRRHQEAAQRSTRRLLGLFVIVLVGLVVAVNAALAGVYWLSFPFARHYPSLFFETNTAVVLLFVLGGCWLESLRLREGGPHVARMAGGRPAQVSGHTASDRLERRLNNIVQEMALASRLPAPAVWVLARDDAINAFAAGWSPDDAVVAVTRGALERLTRAELQGVVAHEFSHIAHGDTRLNMRLIGMVWGLQMVFMLGRSLAQRDAHGRRPAGTLFGLALMGAGSLGWAAGRLLQAAISRQREFLADASAVQYTRVVDGLGGALRKIADQVQRGDDALHAAGGASLAHLYLSSPAGWRWWSTHPLIDERLQRLYGHPVAPLRADALPPPADVEPAMALAPRPGGPSASPGAAAPTAAARGDATGQDATQDARWHGAAARETEALARIARWQGPGECSAALLMLLDGGADLACTGASPLLQRVLRAELDALRPGLRLPVFRELARRAASAPPARRSAWLVAARAAGGAQQQLLRLALRRWWDATPRRIAPAQRPLGSLQGAVISASALMARAMSLSPEAAQAWCAGTLQRLELPVQRIDTLPSPRQAARLRHLALMQRPMLMRAWVQALPAGALDDDRVADTLLVAGWLLDTPAPPALAIVRPPLDDDARLAR